MKKLSNAKISTHSRIFKYPIEVTDDPKVTMPSGAVPIHFGMQGKEVYVWAMVNPQAKDAVHHFKMHGTGHAIGHVTPDDFVGTIVGHMGTLVWHLFYLGES